MDIHNPQGGVFTAEMNDLFIQVRWSEEKNRNESVLARIEPDQPDLDLKDPKKREWKTVGLFDYPKHQADIPETNEENAKDVLIALLLHALTGLLTKQDAAVVHIKDDFGVLTQTAIVGLKTPKWAKDEDPS